MGSTKEKLAPTIQERLKGAPQYSWRRCIYRVPNLLRQTNEEAYTPMLVSIGPLHHSDKRLAPMEPHKLKYLQFFLDDAQVNDADLLSECLEIVKGNETALRECYGDPIDLCSEVFTQMVLIDSAFLIQLFRGRKYKINQRNSGGDYIFNEPFLLTNVWRDIQLVENQLPFFILDQLYRTAFQRSAANSDSVPPFKQIACEFLLRGHDINSDAYLQMSRDFDTILVSGGHLLHLIKFHSSPVLVNKEVDGNSSNSMVIPTTTQLHEAGVKFQAIKTTLQAAGRIWPSIDIEFDKENWILKIPQFSVYDDTEYISRNMIAFEQFNLVSTRFITDFHIFLNGLINGPEDVDLLVKAGIIQICMGSPIEVSNLINSLNTNTSRSPKGYYFKQISLDLINHCKKRWPKHRATLVHTYFNHPWAIISVVYAIVLLLLTIGQLVVGIIAL